MSGNFRIDSIISLAQESGRCILQLYSKSKNGVFIKNKSDSSPLTLADIKSNEIITNGLTNFGYGYPILSEESRMINWKNRKLWNNYWLVDPLDGTKEFINMNDEFTVNIALIEAGIPIFGVVYAPALDLLYWGGEGHGAWFSAGEGKSTPISCKRHEQGECWKVVASRSHPSLDMANYLASLGDYELISMGSSLKICAVAKGDAHIYPRLGPTSEWDTAAAHAVVRAAGGEIFSLNGAPLRYNQKESLLNPHFIVRSL